MRIDNQLTENFAKNTNFEKYISELNNSLYEVQDDFIENLPEKYPTLHILGAPRSGTTLLMQMISSFLEVGYINNLTAAFWKAPLFGIQLSLKLLGMKYQSDFTSSYGRTNNIYEPHEFGYFWNYHLKYPDFIQKSQLHEDCIDWQQLSKILINMSYAFKAPLVFKSFLLGFHASKMSKYLPKSCYVYIKRDFLENAFSILGLRKTLLGDVEKWASIRPKQFEWLKKENKYIQIAGQILFLEHEYLTQLKNIPAENVLFLNYNEVCTDPIGVLSRVQTQLFNKSGDISINSLNNISFKTKIKNYPKEDVRNFENAYQRLSLEFPMLLKL